MRHIFDTAQALVDAAQKRSEMRKEKQFYTNYSQYFSHPVYLEKHWIADWRGVPLELCQFAGHYLIELRRMRIPCHVALCDYDKIWIAHSQLGTKLTAQQIALLKSTGMVVGERYRFDVSPLGNLCWQSQKPYRRRGDSPERHSPHNLMKMF